VGERLADSAVLIRGSEIVAVGSVADNARLDTVDMVRLDLPDATVLPGLIDAHVHLSFDSGPDPAATLAELDDAALLLGMAARARQLLDSGVTTVRGLSDRRGIAVRLRDTIASGVLPGPRILAATAPLTSPGGHCWFLGGEVTGVGGVRGRIRNNADAGADLIKVMATGGHLTPGGASMVDCKFSDEELCAIVDESHSLGLRVAAHAHGTEGIASATAANVDTIEHCTWLGRAGFEMTEEVVADFVAKEIHVCAAISRNWRGFARWFGPEVAEQLLNRVRWLEDHGVRLIAGTDAGIPGATFDDYVGGLQAFSHVGLPPDRILELATVATAEGLGLGDETADSPPDGAPIWSSWTVIR
jgi:imidazolonepropionase-like amidohydrolase